MAASAYRNCIPLLRFLELWPKVRNRIHRYPRTRRSIHRDIGHHRSAQNHAPNRVIRDSDSGSRCYARHTDPFIHPELGCYSIGDAYAGRTDNIRLSHPAGSRSNRQRTAYSIRRNISSSRCKGFSQMHDSNYELVSQPSRKRDKSTRNYERQLRHRLRNRRCQRGRPGGPHL